jgi:hypothetical protein
MKQQLYWTCVLGGLLVAGSAIAQDMNVMREMSRNCRGDVRTYCPNVGFNPNNIMTCLQANVAKLSPPCQEVTRAMAAAHASKSGPATNGTQPKLQRPPSQPAVRSTPATPTPAPKRPS